MKTATVRQIRNEFPTVLQLIRNGESVAITSRRKVVATLSPPVARRTRRKDRPWADLAERLTELQRQPMLAVSGAELIAQDRERF